MTDNYVERRALHCDVQLCRALELTRNADVAFGPDALARDIEQLVHVTTSIDVESACLLKSPCVTSEVK